MDVDDLLKWVSGSGWVGDYFGVVVQFQDRLPFVVATATCGSLEFAVVLGINFVLANPCSISSVAQFRVVVALRV